MKYFLNAIDFLSLECTINRNQTRLSACIGSIKEYVWITDGLNRGQTCKHRMQTAYIWIIDYTMLDLFLYLKNINNYAST